MYTYSCITAMQHNSIIENGQNTEKSPGDLRDLLSLNLQWKTLMSK